MGVTITEALAEIKTIDKRLGSKRNAVAGYLARQDGLKDPLEKDGGSAEYVRRERQGIADLEQRIIDIRRGIQAANRTTTITINGVERSIDEWLTWRREIAPNAKQFLNHVSGQIKAVRERARAAGAGIVATNGQAEKPTDFIINVDERELADQIEQMETTLGQLDGQLSLKNATVQIEA